MLFRLKIVDNGSTTFTAWYTESPTNVNQAIQQARFTNPSGKITVEHASGPPVGSPTTAPYSLQTDPTPTLGADLRLAGHTIIGQLEKQTLVIDGGLI